MFWRGSDNNIWQARYTPGYDWAGPYQLTTTGNLASDPSPALTTSGTWDIFWKGTDGNLWHVYTQDDPTGLYPSWTTQELGYGTLGSAPKAIGQQDGSVEVFWRGGNNYLWHAWYIPGNLWTGPKSISSVGNMDSDPAPVNSSTGTWDIFWKGSNGDLWHSYWNPGGPWTTVDQGFGVLGGQPFATGQTYGTIDVFWKGSNSTPGLWHGWYNPGAWGGPQSLGGLVA